MIIPALPRDSVYTLLVIPSTVLLFLIVSNLQVTHGHTNAQTLHNRKPVTLITQLLTGIYSIILVIIIQLPTAMRCYTISDKVIIGDTVTNNPWCICTFVNRELRKMHENKHISTVDIVTKFVAINLYYTHSTYLQS